MAKKTVSDKVHFFIVKNNRTVKGIIKFNSTKCAYHESQNECNGRYEHQCGFVSVEPTDTCPRCKRKTELVPF